MSGYRKKCQSILEISKSIRYVGVINVYGRTLTGIIKNGRKPLLQREQAKNEFFVIATLLSMRKQQHSSIGELEVAVFIHKKVTLVLFQRKDITYYISVEPTTKFDKLDQIISKIKKLI
ncbi:MAG: hypothetical protein ACE5JT_03060 [Nitrosopumilaceae archaeon]